MKEGDKADFKPKVPTPEPVNIRNRKPEVKSFWEVFVQPDCEWSEKTVKLLKDKNEPNLIIYDIIDKNYVARCLELGHLATPIVMRNGVYWGGYVEVLNFYKQTLIDPGLLRR